MSFDLGPCESSPPGLQMAFSLWPCRAKGEGEKKKRERDWVWGGGGWEGEREREPSGVSSYKDTNPFMSAPPS